MNYCQKALLSWLKEKVSHLKGFINDVCFIRRVSNTYCTVYRLQQRYRLLYLLYADRYKYSPPPQWGSIEKIKIHTYK